MTPEPTPDGEPLFSIPHTEEMWDKIEENLGNLVEKLNLPKHETNNDEGATSIGEVDASEGDS